MATSGLYGSSPTGAVISAPGSESAGLYGNGTTFGGSYFEWFIFIQADTQPATPTGGSWSFQTNSGTPPTGWSSNPPAAPTLPVWVSIALVNSRDSGALVWSAPGVFSYSSGLPILSGTGSPTSGDGLNNQLWIQTGTTPETIWFKQAGTWTRLTGSTLYVDTSSNQTVGGTKTFSSVIQGSVSGTANNVTGIVSITNGGTGQTSANSAFNALAPSQTGNSGKFLTTDGSNTSWSTNPLGTVTSVAVSGGTTGLITSGGPITTSGTITLAGTLAVANGGTGVTTSTGSGNVVLSTSPSLTTPTQSSYENWTGITSPSYSEGRMWYDSTSHALSYYNDSSNAVVHIGQDLQVKVINNTGSTIANGSPVYITGTSSGQTYPNIALAKADVAGTSAVIGLTNGAIANGAIGYVTSQGGIDGVNTSTFTVGQVLYLSPYSAGQLMNTIPPTGITVQVGVVSYVDASAGKIYVKQTTPLAVPASIITGTLAIVNGGTGQTTAQAAMNSFAGAVTSGSYLRGNGTNVVMSTIQAADVPTLNQNTTGTAANVTGVVAIANGGTGQTTANAAFNALAPSQTGNSGKYLTTDGTNTSWATNPLGTVTSVSGTGTVSGISLTGTVTTSGSLTLGGTLDLSAYNGSGAFTTLSASSTVTLSGGTANGVLYLNGSKVATSGSALTFDGTSLGMGNPTVYGTRSLNSYTGTTASAVGFSQQISGFGDIWVGSNNSGSAVLGMATGTFGQSTPNNIPWTVSAYGSEQMRLTSTGLGIGTSSPNARLVVKQSSDTSILSGLSIERNGNDSRLLTSFSSSRDQWEIYATYGSTGAYKPISFWTSDTQRLTLDTSGNLGLGVTPSAMNTITAMQLGSTAIIAGQQSGAEVLYLGSNWYYNSGFKYKQNGYASRYNTDSGSHSWYNAPSGTAGNAITFTQAMSLDASGNLLVGQTAVGLQNTNSLYLFTGSSGGSVAISHPTGQASGSYYALFGYGAGNIIGSITQSGTTAVLYNLTSDKRLKNDLGAVTTTDVIANTVIHDFTWKSDGSQARGVFAQEAFEVIPSAVKVGDNGDEVTDTWQVDYSKYVPDIIVELQALRARVAELEAK